MQAEIAARLIDELLISRTGSKQTPLQRARREGELARPGGQRGIAGAQCVGDGALDVAGRVLGGQRVQPGIGDGRVLPARPPKQPLACPPGWSTQAASPTVDECSTSMTAFYFAAAS